MVKPDSPPAPVRNSIYRKTGCIGHLEKNAVVRQSYGRNRSFNIKGKTSLEFDECTGLDQQVLPIGNRQIANNPDGIRIPFS